MESLLRRNSPSPELTEGECEGADTAEKRPGEQWTRTLRLTDLAANISDGVTFEVLHHTRSERIRLSGIGTIQPFPRSALAIPNSTLLQYATLRGPDAHIFPFYHCPCAVARLSRCPRTGFRSSSDLHRHARRSAVVVDPNQEID